MGDSPEIMISLPDGDFEATPINATLFTFAGRSVIENGYTIDNETRDHVFLQTGNEGSKTMIGTYIFAPDKVNAIGALMVEMQFPCVLYRRDIPECDEQAYQRYITQHLEEAPDYIPEEWSNGKS